MRMDLKEIAALSNWSEIIRGEMEEMLKSCA